MQTKPTKADIVDAALALVRLMRAADDEILDAAHCAIARQACSSDYACTHEPLAGLCHAFEAEGKRRVWDTSKEGAS